MPRAPASEGPAGPFDCAFRYWKQRGKKGKKLIEEKKIKILTKSEKKLRVGGWVRKREGRKKDRKITGQHEAED